MYSKDQDETLNGNVHESNPKQRKMLKTSDKETRSKSNNNVLFQKLMNNKETEDE